MGHKVHPIGFRIGIIRDWQAKWYADAHYAESLQEDMKLRQAIQSKYADAAISLVEIARQAKEIEVTIHTARPGIVIGRGGQRVDELSSHLEKLIGKRVRLNIQEIRQPELDANLVAKTIAEQIQRRIAYRRTMKQAIFRTIQAGAKGIRVSCAGRLGDAEIARRQTMHQGQVPLHTIRADIDYGFTEARTTLGRIGVKVWIYKGEILPEPKELEVEEMPAEPVAVQTAEVTAEVAPEAELAEPVAVEAAEAAPEVKTEAKPVTRRRRKVTAAAEPEVKPEEPVAAETVEAVTEVKAEEKPTKPVTRRRKVAAATEAEEKPEEPVAAEAVEAVAEVKAEEKPTKPVTRRRKVAAPAEPEKKPEEPVVAEAVEAVTEVKAEEKPTKPVTRRRRKVAAATEAEEKPEEPVVAEATEAVAEIKAEEKPAKPARKRSKKAVAAKDTPSEAEATLTEKEEKDAAA